MPNPQQSSNLQHSALQTTSHHLQHPHQTQPQLLLNFPQLSTSHVSHPRSMTPPRRYSSSSGVVSPVVALPPSAGVVTSPGGSTSIAAVGSSNLTTGPSTSAAAAAAAAASVNTAAGSNVSSGNNTGGGAGPSWSGAYTCERCGNSYARPHSLNRHMRFECGVEPKFECPICHKKSKHKHNLVLHMRTHQNR
ncbi:longitudinals lacking protein, isoforms A/B/D/L-like [Teleopsis dalmanni]|uniref:longitudinals lacking protein, isoforms A/B/D/L-like n=1 Tax=Teleopsis dalmanni TaxID=139649 RepID=UPI0018CF25DB|nr:longitudinals lacking protein, isoforms A/B/D/L-like [Teleopsis dalmanni]